jgi:hypothetical protein
MASLWQERIKNADKGYKEWASKYRCDLLEQYYRGFHWKGKKDFLTVNYNPYTINLFYSTIKIKLAGLLFQKPSYVLSPTPGNSYDTDMAVKSAQLKQDVLNTIVHNPAMRFTRHLKFAALDSFFRFGIIECGYAADWRNPQKEDPLLKSWDDDEVTETKDRVLDDNDLPVNERFYVKRIPARKFRVGASEEVDLENHEWCGYYEYFYTSTLRRTKGIKWPSGSKNNYLSSEYTSGILGDLKEDSTVFRNLISKGSVSKVWHIFDQVSHKRQLFLDNQLEEPIWEGELERLPLIDIRWDYNLDGFYPIPPCWQWLSPQDEINEAREQMRSFRRRFTRKWQAVQDTIEPEEKEKFASGPDGVIITVKRDNAITPIQNPEIGATQQNALVIAKDDFNIVSGSTADIRGSADRETATKARIMDSRTQIRESADQIDFSDFVTRIGRELLAQTQERLVDGLWVKYTSGPSTDGGQAEMQSKGPVFKWISSQEISDGYDYTIELDVQNATPAAMQQAQEAFLTFLSLVAKFPMIAMSPDLIREAAYRCGYRNERIIEQMQKAAQLQMAMQQAASQTPGGGAAGPGGPGNNGADAASTQIAQQASPSVDQIDQQLEGQLS